MKITDETIQPTLLPCSFWRPLQERDFAPLGKARAMAESTLITFHNRHVGIPPAWVAAVIPSLQSNRIQPGDPWDLLLDHLREVLTAEEDNPHVTGTGLFLAAAPMQTLFHLVLPLTAAACQRIGKNYLFSEDDGKMKRLKYDVYTRELRDALLQLIQDDSWRLPLKEVAMDLSNRTRYWMPQFNPPDPLPQTPDQMRPLIFEMEPELKERSETYPPARVHSVVPNRPVRHRRESGVSGVRITTSEADLNQILMSEFLNPPLIRRERIMSSGFMILEREPKQEKLRHLLLVGMMLPDLVGTPGGDVAKACWLHFCARMGPALRQHKMDHSEFRWIEPADLTGMRTSSHLLTDLPQNMGTMGETLAVADLANHLRFFPAFINKTGRVGSLGSLRKKLLAGNVTDPQQRDRLWLHAAWRAQQDHIGWQTGEGPPSTGTSQRLQLDHFGRLYVMFFSRRTTQSSNKNPLSRYAATLRLDQSKKQTGVLTLAPEQADQFHHCSFRARNRNVTPLSQTANLPASAGKLIDLWREDLHKEIWNG